MKKISFIVSLALVVFFCLSVISASPEADNITADNFENNDFEKFDEYAASQADIEETDMDEEISADNESQVNNHYAKDIQSNQSCEPPAEIIAEEDGIYAEGIDSPIELIFQNPNPAPLCFVVGNPDSHDEPDNWMDEVNEFVLETVVTFRVLLPFYDFWYDLFG